MKLRPIKLLAVCLTLPAIFFLHARHLKLWFDETVQLSSAHSSHPEKLDPYRYAMDPATAIAFNQDYNMDPGGYTLFLNLMSPVVRNRFHLYRIINIAAFITGLALIVRRLTERHGRAASWTDALHWSAVYLFFVTYLLQLFPMNKPHPAFSGWIPLYILLKSGFSIRAYGFEFLAVSSLLYAADWHRTLSSRRFIVVASILFVGLTLRYDFALIAVSFLAAIAFDAFRRRELRRLIAFPPSWVLLAAVCLGLSLIFWLGYVPQMGGVQGPMKMNYLSYAYLNKGARLVKAMNDPLNIAALALFLYSAFRVVMGRNSFLELVYVFLFLTNLGLSLKGYYPMSLGLDRCLAIVVLFHLLLIQKAIDAMGFLFNRIRSFEGSIKLNIVPLPALLTPLAAVFSFAVVWGSVERHGQSPFISAMTPIQDLCFDSVMSRQTGAAVIIDRASTPNVKAYYQFRGRPMPANEYVCDLAGPHSRQTKPPTLEERCAAVLGRSFDFYLVPELYNSEGMKTFLSRPEFGIISCVHKPNEKTGGKSDVFSGGFPFYRRVRSPSVHGLLE